jgi:hypothetical protein
VKKLIFFILPLLFSACASSPKLASDNQIAPEFRRPPSGALVLIMPAEVEAIDLQAGVQSLKTELHRQLSAAGYRVVALDEDSYDAIWTQEVGEVGGIYDVNTGQLRRDAYVQALGHLVQRVSGETKASLVVRPRLVLRHAELSGVSAVWDGQQRLAPARGGDVRYDGSTLGLSVGLHMFAASGEMVSSTYGGASLPYRFNLHTNKNEVRSDLFADGVDMADGVKLALIPFFK